ncbi:kinase-like protein, partial [Exidia glandulosa HHB12029]
MSSDVDQLALAPRSPSQPLLRRVWDQLSRFTEAAAASPNSPLANRGGGAIDGIGSQNYPLDITRQVRNISDRPVAYGGYADIYIGVWKNGRVDMKVAIKVLRVRSVDMAGTRLLRQLRHEISIWKRLSHPNIHVLCGLHEGLGPTPAMVSPWYTNGDINNYVSRRAGEPEIDIIKAELFLDVTTGLAFLHEYPVVHGDIKGGNVLISDDGVARLCDFGLSRLLVEHSQSITHTGVRGSSRWMAPELFLDGERHSSYSDIWAMGCLLLEVWSATLPYYTK